MPDSLVSKRDIDFVLYEQFEILGLTEKPRFEYFSRDEFDMVVEQAKKFAGNELEPANEDGDRIGASWKNGEVKLPESFYRPLKIYGEQGWVSACDDPELGGQGLPMVVYTACNEMFHAANTSLNLYPSLAHGTATMIREYGTEEQKAKYLDKLMTYQWAGSMNLTEPGAGSDLSRVVTKAVKVDDKRYKISGQKIFITGGEHDAHPNIVHPVLARIEGDPDGIKGISIFLVPKYHVNDDGSIGERNDVKCVGIEHKMGIRGSATCQMSFGDNGECIGEILGKPCQGIQIMFLIMNEERLNVGVQGLGIASAAYLRAVEYTRERLQGADIRKKGKNNDIVPIINHPDVRRNLLGMKGMVEGLRALNYYTAFCIDRYNAEDDPEVKKMNDAFVEFFTPLCKAYTSLKGFDVCSNAMNAFGGYGYCQDYPVEQYLRDHKITALYEGTNAIHSIDLFSRKIKLLGGRVYEKILGDINAVIDRASKNGSLGEFVDTMKSQLAILDEVKAHLDGLMESGKVPEAFVDTLPFLEVVGDVIMGWMHLWQLAIATEKFDALCKNRGCASEDDKRALVEDSIDAAYYSGKMHSSRFFFRKYLPQVRGKADSIMTNGDAALMISDESF